MIAGQQDVGHGLARKNARAGVLGVFEERLGEGVPTRRSRIAQDSGNETGNGVHDDHGSQFSAAQDVVSDGNLVVTEVLGHPFINPFIPSADEDQTGNPAQVAGDVLREQTSLGSQQQNPGIGAAFSEGVQSPNNGLGLHDHALSTSERPIVRDLVLVRGIVPNVVYTDLYQTPVYRLAKNALPHGGIEHAGKQGQNVKDHPSNLPEDRSPSGSAANPRPR